MSSTYSVSVCLVKQIGGLQAKQEEDGKVTVKKYDPKQANEERDEMPQSLVTYSKIYQEQNQAKKEQAAQQTLSLATSQTQNTAIPQNNDGFNSFAPEA